tara:strand:+ start:302 stop:673 length:372 start_codon:yes stop_codon:yes gene_type:complete
MREETILTLMFAGMGTILVFVSSIFVLPDLSRITGSASLAIRDHPGILLSILVLLGIMGSLMVAFGLRNNLRRNKFSATAFVSTGDPLTDYITYAKKAKRGSYRIKSELMSVGWSEEEINKRL